MSIYKIYMYIHLYVFLETYVEKPQWGSSYTFECDSRFLVYFEVK